MNNNDNKLAEAIEKLVPIEDDWLNATSRGDILRAANIHNVNHLGE